MDPGSGAFLFASPEESIHANLRHNDEEFTDLHLWLSSSTNILDLIDALWWNTTVQEATLLIHESFVDQPEREVLFLFSALGRLPRLKGLFFNTYRFHFTAILPIRSLTNVFRSNRRLVEFKLWRTELCRSHYDEDASVARQFAVWGAALANSRCLGEFRLVKCRLTEEMLVGSTDATDALDSILRGLSRLPNLKNVELSATKAGALGSLSPQALTDLMHSPSLESVSLCNFDLSETAVVAVAEALLPNNQDCPTRGKPKSSAFSMAGPSSTKSQVKHLRLSGAGGAASVFPKSIRVSFRAALECNYRLESLYLFDARNLQNEIAFYLKLNRFGRSRLLQDYNGSRREWVEMLGQVSDDLDCLFYFIGINPLLFCEIDST